MTFGFELPHYTFGHYYIVYKLV